MLRQIAMEFGRNIEMSVSARIFQQDCKVTSASKKSNCPAKLLQLAKSNKLPDRVTPVVTGNGQMGAGLAPQGP